MIEIVNKIHRIECEQKRRRQSKQLSRYNSGGKVHLKSRWRFTSARRNATDGYFGGNRSGKTECGAVETVWLARGIHPLPSKYKPDVSVLGGVCCRGQVQRDVAQRKKAVGSRPVGG